MTVVVDARKIPPPPYFFKALTMLQVLNQGHKPPFTSTIDAVQREIIRMADYAWLTYLLSSKLVLSFMSSYA